MLGPDAAKITISTLEKDFFLKKEWQDPNFSGFSKLSRTST